MNDKENIKNENSNEDIEVIEGDGKDLNISPVYNHIKLDKSNTDKNKKIVIPKDKEQN